MWRFRSDCVSFLYEASTLASLGMHLKKPWILVYPQNAQQRHWLDCTDTEVDPGLHWSHVKGIHVISCIASHLYDHKKDTIPWPAIQLPATCQMTCSIYKHPGVYWSNTVVLLHLQYRSTALLIILCLVNVLKFRTLSSILFLLKVCIHKIPGKTANSIDPRVCTVCIQCMPSY